MTGRGDVCKSTAPACWRRWASSLFLIPSSCRLWTQTVDQRRALALRLGSSQGFSEKSCTCLSAPTGGDPLLAAARGLCGVETAVHSWCLLAPHPPAQHPQETHHRCASVRAESSVPKAAVQQILFSTHSPVPVPEARWGPRRLLSCPLRARLSGKTGVK